MAIINIKKKIEKNAAKLRIDEPVLAACTTNPTGTISRMMTRELGAVGAAVAGGHRSATEAVDAEHGMAAQFPNGQHFLVLTEQRVLLTDVSLWTGSPKKIVAEWPREAVVALQVDKGRMAAPLTVAFADGTAVQVEGAKGTDPGSLAEAFA